MLRLFVVSCFLTSVAAYSAGGSNDVCSGETNTLLPGHGVGPQNDPGPYTITVPSTQYAPSSTMEVTISGGDNRIKGFLLVAESIDSPGTYIGSFTAGGATPAANVQSRCDGFGITHTSEMSKDGADIRSVTLVWNSPASAAGSVRFTVTIVKEFNTFWLKQTSGIIWDGQGTQPVEETTQPAGPVTDPPPLAGGPVTQDGCGSTASCYSKCEDNACEYILKWTASGNLISFELMASNVDAGSYVALGIAPNDKMADVTVMACAVDGQRGPDFLFRYAADRTGLRAIPGNSGSGQQTSYTSVDGKKTLECRFTYDNSNTADAELKDLGSDWYAFIAKGPFIGGDLSKHPSNPRPVISPQKINFLSSGATGAYINIGGEAVSALAKAHGCLMIFAWVLCASIGIILARYYKPMWEDKQQWGQKVWFSNHRMLMLICMFTTVIAIILIFVENDGWSLPTELPAKAHPILGLITLICALLNPILAAFRCHPGDKKRPIFNWVHWFFGTVGHIFGSITVVIGLTLGGATTPKYLYIAGIIFVVWHLIFEIIMFVYEHFIMDKTTPSETTPVNKADEPVVAIFLGMLLPKAFVPWWLTYVMMAFCLFHVLVEFTLEILQCCTYDKNRDRQETYEMQSKGDPKAPGPKHAGSKFKNAMLAIYVTVVVILAIVMIVVVAINGVVVNL